MNTTITIAGNVTRSPELRFTASGLPTASFGVAVNRKLPAKADAVAAEAVTFFNVVAWQSLAENVAESLNKGDRVLVTGRLDQRSWETPDGERRTVYELVAEEIGPSLRWVTAALARPERTPRVAGAPVLASVLASGGASDERTDADEPSRTAASGEPF